MEPELGETLARVRSETVSLMRLIDSFAGDRFARALHVLALVWTDLAIQPIRKDLLASENREMIVCLGIFSLLHLSWSVVLAINIVHQVCA